MTRTAIIAAALASVLAFPAHAQTAPAADDVIVMRRVVTPPKVENTPSHMAGQWQTTSWEFDDDGACTATAGRHRQVSCVANGKVVDEARCAAAKPASTGTVERFEGCGYAWQETVTQDWTSTCSATATRRSTSICRRSDGTTVEDARCTGQRPPDLQTGNVTGCTTSWEAGAWNATCAPSATRTVQCKRSDGTYVADDQCHDAKPRTDGAALDGCGFSWATGTYGAYNTSCSDAATRSRTVTCNAVQGQTSFPTDDIRCDAGTKPSTQSAPERVTTGCDYVYSYNTRTITGACSGTMPVSVAYSCFPRGNTASAGAAVADTLCNAQGISKPSSETFNQACGALKQYFVAFDTSASTGNPISVITVAGIVTSATARQAGLDYCNKLNAGANSGAYCWYKGYRTSVALNKSEVMTGILFSNPEGKPTTFSITGTTQDVELRSYLRQTNAISTANLPGLNQICPSTTYGNNTGLVCM